jgi:c-di-GMP-binding flagellar brake protein YcgR
MTRERNERKHQRFAIQVAAEVTLGNEIVIAATHNLSQEGAGLVLDRSVADGAKIRVTLFLTQDGIEDPDEEPFEALAVVRWSAEQDDGSTMMGVQFPALSPPQAKQLERFLTALAG